MKSDYFKLEIISWMLDPKSSKKIREKRFIQYEPVQLNTEPQKEFTKVPNSVVIFEQIRQNKEVAPHPKNQPELAVIIDDEVELQSKPKKVNL